MTALLEEPRRSAAEIVVRDAIDAAPRLCTDLRRAVELRTDFAEYRRNRERAGVDATERARLDELEQEHRTEVERAGRDLEQLGRVMRWLLCEDQVAVPGARVALAYAERTLQRVSNHGRGTS